MAELSERRRRGVERIIALVFSLVLLAPVVWEARLGPKDFRLPRPIVAGDDILQALRYQGHARMVSVYVGLAAREVSGGKVDRIVVPPNLNDIADREPDYFRDEPRSAFNELFITQSSGARIEREPYETLLTEEQLTALDAEYERVEYPADVVVFVPRTPEEVVRLHTDSERTTVYVVPGSALEGVGR